MANQLPDSFANFTQMPDTYSFNGDAVTFLGLIGIVSTLVIMVTAYRRYWKSPYRR
jgi:hypothetical protein